MFSGKRLIIKCYGKATKERCLAQCTNWAKLHAHTLLEWWGRAFGKSDWSSNSKYLRTGAKFHAVENYAPVHGRGLIPQDLEIWSVSFNPKGRLLNRIWDNLGSRGEVPCGMKKEGRKSERAKERFMENQPKCLNLELKPGCSGARSQSHHKVEAEAPAV